MYFNKIHHPKNFTFAAGCADSRLDFGFTQAEAQITDHGEDCFQLTLAGERWGEREGLNELTPPDGGMKSTRRLVLGDDAALRLLAADGREILGPGRAGSIAIAGTRWLIEFAYDPALRFYGMGEKTGSLEKTGKRTKFWNTDVFADFKWPSIQQGDTDPMYVSIPYLATRTAAGWVGLLIDNPYPSFCSAGGEIGSIANQQGVASNRRFYLGAEAGAPSLWVIVADSLAELTERYQRLVGRTPMPPLWALGHHQCRWGYSSVEDLHWVKQGMAQAGIPNSGLWLDIEYMDEYRVFTWNDAEEGWSDVPALLAELQADGQRVVPILDPGVKKDPGYVVHDAGHQADIWCKTEDGVPFVGYVWPGETLFPDYLTTEGRDWWAAQTEAFARAGIHGAWCDMNDPSVGPVELDPMRFRGGELEHEAGHNQYGAQMARATRAGIQAAHPEERPFVLGRSGYTGCQQHTALWTGDNMSNWTYLRGAIPCSLNLALSGVPLNGPDVPGFAEEADEHLALRWYQAGFLFPFLRNHCMKGNSGQEPFTYSRPVREAVRHLIRLRYRLLPYLYQQWIAQEERGTAIMRPLIHDFDDERFTHTDDAFLIGPALLQAPIVQPRSKRRELTLPDGHWFDLRSGAWTEGGSHTIDLADTNHTPLYARSGTVVPMQREEPTDHHVDLATVDLHCFLREGESCEVIYHADDGETWAYRAGKRSTWRATITATADAITVSDVRCDAGWRPISVRVVAYGGQTTVNGVHTEALAWRATGEHVSARIAAL